MGLVVSMKLGVVGEGGLDNYCNLGEELIAKHVSKENISSTRFDISESELSKKSGSWNLLEALKISNVSVSPPQVMSILPQSHLY